MRELAGHGLAVDALGFFGIPLDEGGRVLDLAARLADRLAHLVGHQPGQAGLVLQDGVVPRAQDLRALVGGAIAPAGERVDAAAAATRASATPALGTLSTRAPVAGFWTSKVGLMRTPRHRRRPARRGRAGDRPAAWSAAAAGESRSCRCPTSAAAARAIAPARRSAARSTNRRARSAGLHDLDRLHRAQAAHVADLRVARLERGQRRASGLGLALRLLQDVLLLEHVEDGQRRRARHRVAGVGAAQSARLPARP